MEQIENTNNGNPNEFDGENEFDRVMNKLLFDIQNIQPSTESKNENFKLSRNPTDGLSKLQTIIYFAKKNGKDVDAAVATFEQQKEKNIAYCEKVYGYNPRRQKTAKKDKIQLMPYETAKSVFWHEYLKQSVFPNEYKIDKYNGAEIGELLKYFIQDPTGKINQNKGICLIGGKGTGKSNLMVSLSKFCTDYKLDTAFNFVKMRDVTRAVSSKGIQAIEGYFLGDICFDDIAVGSSNIKTYGTEVNPLEDLIHVRYDRFVKPNSRPTHFTSNLNFNPKNESELELLKGFYDELVIDRLLQMCNFVYLGGNSRRV